MKSIWALATLAMLLISCSQVTPDINEGPACDSPGIRGAVSPSELTLLPRDTAQLKLEVFDCLGNIVNYTQATWSSKDPTIATVDATGLVTAKTSGGTQIIVAEKEFRVGGVVEVIVTTAPEEE